jgi:squalene synthase HpnC
MMTTATPIETPSGKGAAGENFPVGSWLLSARLRPHVATFYAFARAIDDIADNPELAPEDKISRLDGFASALVGDDKNTDKNESFAKSHRLRTSLQETGVPAAHGLDLIAAFKQDATKGRYHDWAELMDYCRLSAAPVGRYLLDLHGESKNNWPAADALCNALQVINHLQDCQDDYRDMDRVYLPENWLAEAGAGIDDLDKTAASPGLRRVIDRCLDGTEELLAEAAKLPARLTDTRLALETSVIVEIAVRLCAHLRRRDPLAERVKLKPVELALCGAKGVVGVLASRLAKDRGPAA